MRPLWCCCPMSILNIMCAMLSASTMSRSNQPYTYITREYPMEWKQGEEAYYPVNDAKNQKLYTKYAELAKKEKDVIFGGRLAEYKYYDMDDVVRSALDCAKRVLD